MAKQASVLDRKYIHLGFWTVATSLILASILGSVAIISQWASLPDVVYSNSKIAAQALEQATQTNILATDNQKSIKTLTTSVGNLADSVADMVKTSNEKDSKMAVALGVIATKVEFSNKLNIEQNKLTNKLIDTQTVFGNKQALRRGEIDRALEHIKDKGIHNGR